MYTRVMNLSGMNNNGPPPNINNNPGAKEIYDAIAPYQFMINVSVEGLALICAAVIIAAGVMMLQRKMYPLCVAGSILAAIPCLSFLACCLVGEGVGVWALVILMSADVKRSFQG